MLKEMIMKVKTSIPLSIDVLRASLHTLFHHNQPYHRTGTLMHPFIQIDDRVFIMEDTISGEVA